MNKLYLLSILALTTIAIIYSCSTEEEDTTPPPSVVATPEPEPPAPTQYTLTVTAGEGGSVSTEGGTYDEGTEITINATPDEGYEFVGWEGSDSDSNSLTVTLNGNTNIQAIFSFEGSSESENDTSIIYNYNNIELDSPPFGGTIFITGDIITSSDPSNFNAITYSGIEARQMYDRRNGGAWIDIQPYIFDATFSDSLNIEIQVNSEFTFEDATVEAEKYGFLVGQLSKALRKDVETMWIHKGTEAYGGGNNNILIHTGQTEFYENYGSGIVEETLIHEATHTSIDAYHYPDRETNGEKWIETVNRDEGCYISDYARDNPYREDLAELMPLYIATKYFPERITSENRDKILSCNINRIKYLDSLNLDMSIYEN